MVRSLVFGSISTLLLTGSLHAADLAPRPAPAAFAPVYSWTGFYAGVNVGANWGGDCKTTSLSRFDIAVTPRVYTPVAGFDGGCNNSEDAGILGGGQVGYNAQFGQMVLGVETDFDVASQNRSATTYVFGTPAQIGGGGGTTVPFGVYAFPGENSNKFIGTLRARLGFAIDRTLLYVTGGLAYGSHSGNGGVAYYNGSTATGAPTAVFTRPGSNNSGVGYVLGVGVEHAISNTWSVKLEYLHADLGHRGGGGYSTSYQPAFTTTNYTLNTPSSRVTSDSIRVGLNYRFN
jgi:outer membrane immunogenic protein